MASASSEIDVALEELEARLERLRALYEQYFIGIEKIEPSVPRQDVDRRIYALRKAQIRNTAKRFKLQTIIQRYNAFQQYWLRICREIENGTYHRHVARAQSRFGDVPLTAAARRRARLQGQNQTDEQKAAVEEKAKARKEADDDLEALLGEDLDVALSRALLAAADVELIRVDPEVPSTQVQATTPSKAAAEMKLVSVTPPRPKAAPVVDTAVPAKPLAPKPPPRAKPPGVATPEGTAGAAAAPRAAATISPQPVVSEGPAAAPRAAAVPPARRAPVHVPSGASKAPAAILPAKSVDAAVARPGPEAPAPAPAAVPAGASPRRSAGAPPVVGTAPVAASQPDQARTKPVLAKEGAVPKAKPKAAAQADGWAALRMPSAQRQGPSASAGDDGPSAVSSARRPAPGTRAESRAPPRSEPARAAPKPRVPAAPPGQQPLPGQATPASSASDSKAEPKPLAAELAPRPAAARVTEAALSPRAPVVPEAPAAPPADARAAAAARRVAAERAAEIRSQPRVAPEGAGMDDQRLSQLHGALVAERRRLNQPGKVSKDALAASLRDTESKLRKQYGDKQIDFHVVVKDGKAVVKPIVG